MFKNPNVDCLYKNFSILDLVLNTSGGRKKFLDCGSGPSPLSYLLCEYFEEGHMIDIGVANPFNRENLHHNIGDFFEYLSKIEDYSLDYALDGCSVTHFKYDNEKNTGLIEASSLLSKKIKKGGYFIMSTDVIGHDDGVKYNQSEFLKTNDIINIFEKNNLILTTEFDYDSLEKNFNIDLDYHNRFRINLNYCNLTFQKK
jgi:hypothetical protein